jgi:hypothetical protein
MELEQKIAGIHAHTEALVSVLETLGIDDKVSALNHIRQALHEASPFKGEPVDFVQWVKVTMFEHWWRQRGYPEGIPDEAAYEMEAARRAPSWRRVCKSLLRNDYWCKGLGFSQHKSEGYKKYLDLMERRKKQWEGQYELLV